MDTGLLSHLCETTVERMPVRLIEVPNKVASYARYQVCPHEGVEEITEVGMRCVHGLIIRQAERRSSTFLAFSKCLFHKDLWLEPKLSEILKRKLPDILTRKLSDILTGPGPRGLYFLFTFPLLFPYFRFTFSWSPIVNEK